MLFRAFRAPPRTFICIPVQPVSTRHKTAWGCYQRPRNNSVTRVSGNRGGPEVPTRYSQCPLRRWCDLCQPPAGNAEPEASGNSSRRR
jgi:hypothetical protein